MAALLGVLEPDGARVTFVHGIGGIGKSSLLGAFAAQAQARGTVIIRLDCRAIEPTERGFLGVLGAAIGAEPGRPQDVGERLAHLGQCVVLALDTYEVFRLLDTWLRQTFVPGLEENVRVILAGREPPVSAWLATLGWQGLFRSLALGPLDERESAELLAYAGVFGEDAHRINRLARGHPLTLKLAAAAMAERNGLNLEEVVTQRLIEELTRLYLADIRDPLTREALDASSVVRRTTLSLLGAMLPQAAPQDAFERLRALPFVQTGSDGLVVHDTLREALSAAVRGADPARYRAYRRAAWRQLRSELRSAPRAELWRYTADMLYILENPVAREAFFPSGTHQYVVEPARPQDGSAIHAIVEQHEGREATRWLDTWWVHAPASFSVVRDGHGAVAGFYCMWDPATIPQASLPDDPIVRAWSSHLRQEPMPKNQRALFLRRWLTQDGEVPSAVQAACWLDVKRTYIELRPQLRRVYLTVCDLATYAPAATKLGFRLLPEAEREVDGRTYHSAVLDFGPASVDGWLSSLVAAELGIEEDGLLDIDAHELLVDGRRAGLTRLEFGVMQYLYHNEGKAVSRQSLLSDVWGYDYEGGSNVVDVVMRSLRKKLGSQARSLETVSGVGYRFRRS